MGQSYRIEKVAPEFYFHFKVNKPFTEGQFDEVSADLGRLARKVFQEAFPDLDVEFEFEIDLERGSIRGRIRSSSRAVVRILQGLALLGGAVAGGQFLWTHSTDALTWLKDEVEEYFDHEYGIEDEIRTERRRGAVARLDHLIARYQAGELTDDAYLAESTAILEKIQRSPERDDLIPALRQYLDAKQIDWEELANGLPPRPPIPEEEQRLPPAAILREEDRRRLPGGMGGTNE